MSFLTTENGFKSGIMEVIALYSNDDRKKSTFTGAMIEVRNAHHKIQVYSSPQGRNLRVWLDGKEMEVINEESKA